MLQVTKIFRFQAAHAIYGYPGQCSNLHGHSYALHVTVSGEMQTGDYLAPPGFILDFKELKHIVKYTVVDKLDHHTILSKDYLAARPSLADLADVLGLGSRAHRGEYVNIHSQYTKK